MAKMGHLSQMIRDVADHKLKQRLIAQAKKPRELLDFAEVPAGSIDKLYVGTPQTNDGRLRWTQDGKRDELAPITCRLLNMSKLYADKAMPENTVAGECINACMKLRKQGCNAVPYEHIVMSGEGSDEGKGKIESVEICLAVPCTTLVKKEGRDDPVTIRDIASAEKFFIYAAEQLGISTEEVQKMLHNAFVAAHPNSGRPR